MLDSDAQRVFERFYRADPARARTHGGSGLGLSIVAAIVTAHGGTVSAASTPGEGLVVTVLIPLSTVELPRDRAAATGELSPPSA
jgi:two-component system OmpR family sensor kinase